MKYLVALGMLGMAYADGSGLSTNQVDGFPKDWNDVFLAVTYTSIEQCTADCDAAGYNAFGLHGQFGNTCYCFNNPEHPGQGSGADWRSDDSGTSTYNIIAAPAGGAGDADDPCAQATYNKEACCASKTLAADYIDAQCCQCA